MRNDHIYIYSNNAFYFLGEMSLTIRSYSIAVVCCSLYLLLIPFLCQRHRESFFILHALQRINNFVGVGHDTA